MSPTEAGAGAVVGGADGVGGGASDAEDTASSAGTSTFCQSSPSSTMIAINEPTLMSAEFSGFCKKRKRKKP